MNICDLPFHLSKTRQSASTPRRRRYVNRTQPSVRHLECNCKSSHRTRDHIWARVSSSKNSAGDQRNWTKSSTTARRRIRSRRRATGRTARSATTALCPSSRRFWIGSTCRRRRWWLVRRATARTNDSACQISTPSYRNRSTPWRTPRTLWHKGSRKNISPRWPSSASPAARARSKIFAGRCTRRVTRPKMCSNRILTAANGPQVYTPLSSPRVRRVSCRIRLCRWSI